MADEIYSKTMEQVKVYINSGGNITIAQDNPMTQKDDIISVSAEQVDLLIKWLEEAKKAAIEFKTED